MSLDAVILNKLSKQGYQIGDYIQTEATTLPDGRRLIPSGPYKLDVVEYPLLAAILPKTFQSDSSYPLPARDTNYYSAIQCGDYYCFCNSNTAFVKNMLTGVIVVSKNKTRDVVVGCCCSDDYQTIYVLEYINASVHTLYKSTDGGSNWTGTSLSSTYLGSGGTYKQYITMQCSSDGSEVIITCAPTGYCLRGPTATTTVTTFSPTINTQYTFISRDLGTIQSFDALSLDGGTIFSNFTAPTTYSGNTVNYISRCESGRMLAYYAPGELHYYSDDGLSWSYLDLRTIIPDGSNISGNLLSSDGKYLHIVSHVPTGSVNFYTQYIYSIDEKRIVMQKRSPADASTQVYWSLSNTTGNIGIFVIPSDNNYYIGGRSATINLLEYEQFLFPPYALGSSSSSLKIVADAPL